MINREGTDQGSYRLIQFMASCVLTGVLGWFIEGNSSGWFKGQGLFMLILLIYNVIKAVTRFFEREEEIDEMQKQQVAEKEERYGLYTKSLQQKNK